MFEIGLSECLLVITVALFLIKPQELPKIIAYIKNCMRSFNKIKQEIKSVITSIETESGLMKVKKDVDEILKESSTRYVRDESGNYHPAYDISDFLEDDENKDKKKHDDIRAFSRVKD